MRLCYKVLIARYGQEQGLWEGEMMFYRNQFGGSFIVMFSSITLWEEWFVGDMVKSENILSRDSFITHKTSNVCFFFSTPSLLQTVLYITLLFTNSTKLWAKGKLLKDPKLIPCFFFLVTKLIPCFKSISFCHVI